VGSASDGRYRFRRLDTRGANESISNFLAIAATPIAMATATAMGASANTEELLL